MGALIASTVPDDVDVRRAMSVFGRCRRPLPLLRDLFVPLQVFGFRTLLAFFFFVPSGRWPLGYWVFDSRWANWMTYSVICDSTSCSRRLECFGWMWPLSRTSFDLFSDHFSLAMRLRLIRTEDSSRSDPKSAEFSFRITICSNGIHYFNCTSIGFSTYNFQ